jgi:hypothetical protein
MWSEVEGTQFTPEMYVRLMMMESEYRAILEEDDAGYYGDDMAPLTIREDSYNRVIPAEDATQTPPAFGVVGLDLERVYLGDIFNDSMTDDNEHDDGYELINLQNVGKQNTLEFECPICYETQTCGNECILTMCEHKYCKRCFEGMVWTKAECGMCRKVIVSYIELSVESSLSSSEAVGMVSKEEEEEVV